MPVTRLGILGGSFDPPHLGHLHVARAARNELQLDRIRLLPAGHPPHKPDRRLAADSHRVAMLERLVAAAPELAPALEIDPRELERAGTSYTYDTLVELRRELPVGTSLYFLIGSDSLADLPGWHRSAELFELATFVTVPRDRATLVQCQAALRAQLPAAVARKLLAHVLDVEPLPISSTELRARIRAGLPIRDLVPAAIADYIDQHRLYRAPAGPI